MTRKKLGKYEITDRIGRGGMAEVYRGYHVSLDRYVAIKLLHPFLADDPEFKDRFENEARNVAKLKHPNIVQVYDFDFDPEGESYYMVMELINGPTLKDKLFELASSGERFSIAESIRVVRAAAEALAYAHLRNMIHRDVKPANLMLDEDERVVLTDFGIAKIVTGTQFTASGGMVGTPAYMAPEQGLGEAGNERSDLYSLGVILFQLVTGRLPFDADTPLGIILKHVNEPLPSPRSFMPTLSEDMESIICRVLAKDPEDRYPSAAEFANDLASLDEAGNRRAQAELSVRSTGLFPAAETKPDALTNEQRARLLGNTEATTSLSVPASLSTTPVFVQQRGVPGRLRPASIVGLIAALVLIASLGLIALGNDNTLFASLTENNTNTPVATSIAQVPLVTETQEATEDPELPVTEETSVTPPIPNTPVPTTPAASDGTDPATLTPSRTPKPSATPTVTFTATYTPSPTITHTPTPNKTETAAYIALSTLMAATPTPNMTQTLGACDFEFIVVQPTPYPAPPNSRDFTNPRLVRSGTDSFSFEIVVQNTGNCDWPKDLRLHYNEELTLNPDETVDMKDLTNACETAPIGLNFALQGQKNFYLRERVRVTQDSGPIVFTGTAPDLPGCYYGVWDLYYPNSEIKMGRPLVISIRAWGSVINE